MTGAVPQGTDGSDPPGQGEATPSEGGLDTAQIAELFGGPRGLLESTVPGVVFAIVYALDSRRLGPALWAAVGTAAVILLVAVAQRRSVRQTLAGFFGVVLMAGIALVTGRARDFYLFGLFRNAFFLALYLVSLLVRFPLIGVIIGPVMGEGLAWRHDRRRMRAYDYATLVWAALFGIRLAVQYKLFAADKVVALGFVNLALGLPLFLAACAATWLILRRVPPVRPGPEEGLDIDDIPIDAVPEVEPDVDALSEPQDEERPAP